MAMDAFEYVSTCERTYAVYEFAWLTVGDPAFQLVPYDRQFDCMLAVPAFEVCWDGFNPHGMFDSPPRLEDLTCALEIMAGTSNDYAKNALRYPAGFDDWWHAPWSYP